MHDRPQQPLLPSRGHCHLLWSCCRGRHRDTHPRPVVPSGVGGLSNQFSAPQRTLPFLFLPHTLLYSSYQPGSPPSLPLPCVSFPLHHPIFLSSLYASAFLHSFIQPAPPNTLQPPPWGHACFRVRVFPVRSLMYRAMSSLRPERDRDTERRALGVAGLRQGVLSPSSVGKGRMGPWGQAKGLRMMPWISGSG